MDYLALWNEINTDPLTRGYSGMTDLQVADDLNTVYRTVDRATMTGSEVYNSVDQTEWTALTDAQRDEIWDIIHMNVLNPFGREADRFVAIFGAGSTTVTTLAGLRVDDVSRANELGFGEVYEGHVTKARALGGG